MPIGQLSRKIDERLATYQKRIEAVFKASAQDVVRGMTQPVAKGGRMRVRTGFLRSSLMASTSAMPLINPKAHPPTEAEIGSYLLDTGPISAVITGAALTDTIYLGFTAAYAAPREHFDAFVEGERLRWSQIVKSNIAKARAAFP